jgi:type IV secretion system protein TrbI
MGMNDDESLAAPGSTTPPLPPRPPLAKRLNRNALTVCAVLAGGTVISVLVMTPSKPSPGAPRGVTAEAPPTPARPAFLDLPPKVPPHAKTVTDSSTGAGIAPAIAPPTAYAVEPAGGAAGAQSLVAPPAPATGPAAPSPRWEAYQAALTAGVVAGEDADAVARGGPLPGVGTGRADDQTVSLPSSGLSQYRGAGGASPIMSPSAAQWAPGPPTGPVNAASLAGPNGPPPSTPPTSGGSLTAPVSGTPTDAGTPPASGSAAEVSQGVRVIAAGSPYTLRAGTLIPGFLITGVNSDVPGDVTGQTSRDVYDTRTERTLLIPKGSRVLGRYDSRSVGSGRLVVAWTRIILPDGRSMTLPGVAAKDETGQSGLHDQVNHHYGQIWSHALMLSVLGAGVELSQPQQTSIYATPSTREVAASAVGQQLDQVALESARRGQEIAPTVVIRPGQPFDVYLNGDVVFDGPYVATP